MTRRLDYLVFDADNHMYEATDAFTKYLPAGYENVIKYVEVNGRMKIAIKNKISDYIPNPTFNVVAPPGAQELEFKLKNPDSMTKADRKAQLTPPPRYLESIVCRTLKARRSMVKGLGRNDVLVSTMPLCTTALRV